MAAGGSPTWSWLRTPSSDPIGLLDPARPEGQFATALPSRRAGLEPFSPHSARRPGRGMTNEEILADFPELTETDIRASAR